ADVAPDRREDRGGFGRRDGRSDADTRAPAKGKVSKLGEHPHHVTRPALGPESIWVLVVTGRSMHRPRVHEKGRLRGDRMAADRAGLDADATHLVDGRIEPMGFLDDVAEMVEPAQRLGVEGTGTQGVDLVLQSRRDRWMLREQVDRPNDARGNGL